MAKLLRRANILACGIGLPLPEIAGDVNGLRMGTPELVRWGMRSEHMPRLAKFIAAVLRGRQAPEEVARPSPTTVVSSTSCISCAKRRRPWRLASLTCSRLALVLPVLIRLDQCEPRDCSCVRLREMNSWPASQTSASSCTGRLGPLARGTVAIRPCSWVLLAMNQTLSTLMPYLECSGNPGLRFVVPERNAPCGFSRASRPAVLPQSAAVSRAMA